MKKPYITLAATLLSIGVSAQTLTKEIVIERDVEPTLPEAARINNYPMLFQPQAPKSRLPFYDVTAATNVPGMLTMLEPANGQPAMTLSPYRGYASLGYFPAYNLGVSAGYSIISKPSSTLNVWTQFNGYSYDDQYDQSIKRNQVTVGADFAHLFGANRRLDISADFTFNAFNRPWENADPDHNSKSFNIDASWGARGQTLAYYIKAGFSHFGFSGEDVGLAADVNTIKGVSQNIIKAGLGASYSMSDRSMLVGDVDFRFANNNKFNTLTTVPYAGIPGPNLPLLTAGDGKTMGIITLAPAYCYTSGAFSTRLGVKAEVTTNTNSTFHIAPDVRFGIRPGNGFGATLTVGGGQYLNALSELYDINPFMSIGQGHKFSEVPLAAELKIGIGPFYGASIELFGGYTIANDWLMPDVADITEAGGVTPVTDRVVYGSMYKSVDLRAVHYGAKLAWKYNKNIEASVKYLGAPGSYRHSYYLNRDRARHVLEANISVTPISPLTIDASFELRASRSLYSHWGVLPEEDPIKYDLRNSNSLNIGATYRFTDYLSVFANVENILGRRAYMFNMLEQQGVHGLVGAAIKF